MDTFEACSGFTRVTARTVAATPFARPVPRASTRPVARPHRLGGYRGEPKTPRADLPSAGSLIFRDARTPYSFLPRLQPSASALLRLRPSRRWFRRRTNLVYYTSPPVSRKDKKTPKSEENKRTCKTNRVSSFPTGPFTLPVPFRKASKKSSKKSRPKSRSVPGGSDRAEEVLSTRENCAPGVQDSRGSVRRTARCPEAPRRNKAICSLFLIAPGPFLGHTPYSTASANSVTLQGPTAS